MSRRPERDLSPKVGLPWSDSLLRESERPDLTEGLKDDRLGEMAVG